MAIDERADRIDAAIAMAGRSVSRRDLLKVAGAGVGYAALAAIISACGGGRATTPPAGGASVAPGASAAPGGSGGAAIQPPATAVNLDFWNPFTGGDGPYLKKIVDQFNSETPNVQVKFSTQKDLYGSLHAAKAANKLPQVSIVHLDAIPQNASDGIFQPIDDLISALGLSEADFTEDVWKNGLWKDHRYGVPLDTHTLSFYWNKALFRTAGLDPETPPTSKDDFVAAAKAITEKAGVPGFMVVQGGGGANFLLGIEWATTFYQGGGEWTNEDFSESLINSQAGVDSSNFWKSLVDDGISPKGTESDTEIAAFKQGKNGMVMSGIWETNGYIEALKDDLGAGPVPQIFGKGVWSGSHNMGITTREMSAEEKQGAQYFISWISEHSLEWAKAGQIPARQSVVNSAEFKALPVIPDIQKQQADARFFPPFPAAGDALFGPQGAGQAAVAAVTGKKDAKAALDEAAANITKQLKENKAKYGF
ncbi:MAG TPA: ABC transporter substrate-binding protein [Candidatus Limnocylindrales bacterium]|nr:ABC transporter substrate-binding protein [Candidatus Limnocylindrales bacterium]